LATASELASPKAEATISGKGWSRERLLGAAEDEAKVIAADDLRFSPPFAAQIRAGIAFLRGNRDQAIGDLEAARDGFATADMRLYEACAKYVRGVLRGEQREIDTSLAFMRAQHITRPERIVGVLMPGLPTDPSSR
jgi:hypothetical protein